MYKIVCNFTFNGRLPSHNIFFFSLLFSLHLFAFNEFENMQIGFKFRAFFVLLRWAQLNAYNCSLRAIKSRNTCSSFGDFIRFRIAYSVRIVRVALRGSRGRKTDNADAELIRVSLSKRQHFNQWPKLTRQLRYLARGSRQ